LQITGTSNATSYILGFDTTTQIAASAGQTWAWASWVAFVSGSLSNVTTVSADFRESNSGGTQLAAGAVALSTLTSSLVRQSATRTLSEATTAFIQPRLRLTIINGAAIDITLRIGLPQLELGAFATSVIPTTTTALTRDADVASMTGTNFSDWYNAAEGSLFGEFSVYTSVGSKAIVGITDGTNNNRVQFFAASNDPFVLSPRLVAGGVATNPANTGNIAVNSVGKAIIAYAVGTNAGGFSINGSSIAQSSPASAFSSVNSLEIGKATGLTQLNGYIRRIAYYPIRLPNEQLQALTG